MNSIRSFITYLIKQSSEEILINHKTILRAYLVPRSIIFKFSMMTPNTISFSLSTFYSLNATNENKNICIVMKYQVLLKNVHVH